MHDDTLPPADARDASGAARPPSRRRLLGAAVALPCAGLLAPLAGCASLNRLTVTVASFGDWPAARAPGAFVFERLPSQRTPDAAPAQDRLEAMAADALQAAGFTPLPDGAATPPGAVRVQVGAQVSRTERAPWDDPLWPGAWVARGARGPVVRLHGPAGGSLLWALPPSDRFLREVAVLLRDAATGEALYEARATTEGGTLGGERLLAAMLQAALKDFPAAQAQPHPVTVPG